MIKLFVFLSAYGLALSLSCYDCGPQDKGCNDPEPNNIKTTECGNGNAIQESITRKLIGPLYAPEKDPECFTMYFDADPGSLLISGIYRGCGAKEKSCRYELEKGTPGRIKSCKKCDTDKCNSDSGAASFTLSTVTVLTGVVTFIITR